MPFNMDQMMYYFGKVAEVHGISFGDAAKETGKLPFIADDAGLKANAMLHSMSVLDAYHKGGVLSGVTEEEAEREMTYLMGNATPVTQYLEEQLQSFPMNDPRKRPYEQYRNLLNCCHEVQYRIEKAQAEYDSANVAPSLPKEPVPYDYAAIAPFLARAREGWLGDADADFEALTRSKNLRSVPGAGEYLNAVRTLRSLENDPALRDSEQAKMAFALVRDRSEELDEVLGQKMADVTADTAHYRDYEALRELVGLYGDTAAMADAQPKQKALADEFRMVLSRAPEAKAEFDAILAKKRENRRPVQNVLDDSFLSDLDDDEPDEMDRMMGYAENKKSDLADRYTTFCANTMSDRPFPVLLSEVNNGLASVREAEAPDFLGQDTSLLHVDSEIDRLTHETEGLERQTRSHLFDFRYALSGLLRNKMHKSDEEAEQLSQELIDLAKENADKGGGEQELRRGLFDRFMDPNKAGGKPKLDMFHEDTSKILTALINVTPKYKDLQKDLNEKRQQLEALQNYGKRRLLENEKAMLCKEHEKEYRKWLDACIATPSERRARRLTQRLTIIHGRMGRTHHRRGDSTEYKLLLNALGLAAAGKGDKKELFRLSNDYIREKEKNGQPRSDVGKARLMFAKEIRNLLKNAASLDKVPSVLVPSMTRSGGADKVISRLEAQNGAPLTSVARENLRALCTSSEAACDRLNEKCRGDEPFAGGDDLRSVVTWESISRMADKGKLPDGYMELLNQEGGASSLRSLTQLSHDVNYLADKPHAPDFYRTRVLTDDAMSDLTKKTSAVVSSALSSPSVADTAVKETKELEKTKQLSAPVMGPAGR